MTEHTLTVGGSEVVVSSNPVSRDLVGSDRSFGDERAHPCPNCSKNSLRYHFLDYRPALSWACVECGYAEHPPIEKLVADGYSPQKVEEDWSTCIYPKEWMLYSPLERLASPQTRKD